MPDETPVEGSEQAVPSCCDLRKKIIIGIVGILPETMCGVSDAALADVLDFSRAHPAAPAGVIAVNFCPWCGQRRVPVMQTNIVGPPLVVEDEAHDPADEWKGGPPEETPE